MTSLVVARGLRTEGRLQPTELDLGGGTLTALIGPNGSGKTSLLHALAGIRPAIGSVEVGGSSLHGQLPARRQRSVGLLTADRHIAWPISGSDLMKLGSAAAPEFGPITEALALQPLIERRVDRLSSGERARLLLARLLASDPQLLLLDEPLANLDPYWQLVVMGLLRKRARRSDRAVVLAIHDLATAVRFADRLLLMADGAIAWDGPAAALQASGEADRVFNAEWTGADWRLNRPEGPRSSP